MKRCLTYNVCDNIDENENIYFFASFVWLDLAGEKLFGSVCDSFFELFAFAGVAGVGSSSWNKGFLTSISPVCRVK